MFKLYVSRDHPVTVKVNETLEQQRNLAAQSVDQRLSFIAQHVQILSDGVDTELFEKNKELGIQELKKGQELLRKKEYAECLEALNKSIQLVEPSQKETIGWIASLRSAAAYEIKFFKESITDCRLALEMLPMHLTVQRFKVWERLALSLSTEGKPTDLLSTLKSIKNELDSSDLEKGMVVNLLDRLAKNLKSNHKSLTSGKDESVNSHRVRNLLTGTDEELDCDSCVCVKVGEAGRYVVATRDINAGEVIIKDPSAAAVLNLPYLKSNCSNCLRAVIAGVPCPRCSQVIFCSTQCLDSAWFHDTECGYVNLYPPLGPFVPVLRLFTSRSLKYFKDNSHLFESYDPTTDWKLDKEGKEISCIYNLQRREKGDSYKISMSAQAVYIIFCLRRMGYFKPASCDSAKLSEDELFIGGLAYDFLLSIDENSHQIVEYNQPGSEFSGSFDSLYEGNNNVVAVIGSAVNRYTSLFNNSCDVNTIKFHQGKTTVLVAKRKIKAGEEVTDFYGVHFFNASLQERRAALGFECLCTPCRQNWGLLHSLPTFQDQVLKKRKKEWAKERKNLTHCVECMDVSSVLESALRLGELAGVEPPHQDLVLPEMFLNYSCCYLFGNKSIKFLNFVNSLNKK